MKLLADATKKTAALKAKAPYAQPALNKELNKIKGVVRGVSFGVKAKDKMWAITPRAGGRTGRPFELAAKDVTDPEKAPKVAKGLRELPKTEKPYLSNGRITLKDAKKVAAQVKRAHPVFTSIRVEDTGNTLKYYYRASDEKSTGHETPEQEEGEKLAAARRLLASHNTSLSSIIEKIEDAQSDQHVIDIIRGRRILSQNDITRLVTAIREAFEEDKGRPGRRSEFGEWMNKKGLSPSLSEIERARAQLLEAKRQGGGAEHKARARGSTAGKHQKGQAKKIKSIADAIRQHVANAKNALGGSE
jgi:hypothetical protein